MTEKELLDRLAYTAGRFRGDRNQDSRIKWAAEWNAAWKDLIALNPKEWPGIEDFIPDDLIDPDYQPHKL